MRESQRRINEYTERLPRIKEKLVAFLLLLVVSSLMLVTVTFAWISLSLSPEVTGVRTSIASNGNLEIALATGVDAPYSSKVGDSKLPLVERNRTWGNLINLSDPQYGLDSLVLRPAKLNEFGLDSNPLYGPVYDDDGRVVDMNTNFGYSAWETAMSRFEPTDQLGVRAITSMTYGVSGDATMYNTKLDAIEAANGKLQNNYQALAYNNDYMDALATMMAGYMVENILSSSQAASMIEDATLTGSNLEQFALMYRDLMSCFVEQATVFAEYLNLHAELNGKLTRITGEEILSLAYDTTNKTAYKTLKNTYGYTTYADSESTVGFIKEIDQFLADYNVIITDVVEVEALRDEIKSKGTQLWTDYPQIDTLIERLVNIKECTITGGEYVDYKLKRVGATAAMALAKVKCCETKITNGILYRFDNRSGARLSNPSGKPLTISVKTSIGNQSITSNVSTGSTDNYFKNELKLAEDIIKNKYGAPELVARDSYGFAVDFWVRTNAENSYLTLQGNVLTELVTIDSKGKDLEGNEVQLYTITIKAETEESVADDPLSGMLSTSHDVYKSTTTVTDENTGEESVVDCYRYASNHTVVSDEDLNGQTPIKKLETIENVIGYEGDNRVWEGDQHASLTVNSTTQGGGSCYVFYSENPVDQARILNLLNSMKVVFIDDKGTLLATAQMDTEKNYATTGKVIVPLVITEGNTGLGADSNGDLQLSITALEKNVATRITALVYLDGTEVTNENVLASADIRGQLNIQFGSSEALVPINNETLYNAELYVQASLDKTQFNYDDGEDMTTHVSVMVTGTQPSSMSAYFIRRINSTQGTPEKTSFILTDEDGDGTWEGDYTFLYPGTYVLRNIQIDGSDKELLTGSDGEFPTVVVEGFTISSVSYLLDSVAMTDESVYTGSVGLEFASNDPDTMPRTVVGKFLREDGATVNVNFAYDATLQRWNGTAKFVSSGKYSMQYVVLDGQYVELAEANRFTIELTMGMRVHIETESPTYLIYGDPSTPLTLDMKVQILDNNGDSVSGLAGVSLVYAMSGTNTLYAGLVWNETENCYEGEFPTTAGTWRFSKVSVEMGENNNTLFSANSDAPVFTIVPPTPPSHAYNVGDEAQYIATSSGNATITVALKDSESATVFAKLVKVDENGNLISAVAPVFAAQLGDMTTVNGIENGEEVVYNCYAFKIPEGIWRIEAVGVFDVFDSNSVLHSMPADGVVDTAEEFEAGVVFDSTADGFDAVTVAALYKDTVFVSVDYSGVAFDHTNAVSKTGYFGKDASGNITGTFMENNTLAAGSVTVTLSDSQGLIGGKYFAVDKDYGIHLRYKYGDVSYGGYTSNNPDYATGLLATTLSFTQKSGSSTLYTLSSDVVLTHAAEYKPYEFTYTLVTYNGDETLKNEMVTNCEAKTNGEYTIEVWSKAPNVQISNAYHSSSAIAAAGKTHYTYDGSTYAQKTSKWSSTEATVYFVASQASAACVTYYNYTPPKVEIELSGYGNADSATLTFSGGVDNQLYSAPASFGENSVTSGARNAYVWSADGKVFRWIGYCANKTGGDDRTAAGNLSADQLVLEYGGYTYTVKLGTSIKINNPY